MAPDQDQRLKQYAAVAEWCSDPEATLREIGEDLRKKLEGLGLKPDNLTPAMDAIYEAALSRPQPAAGADISHFDVVSRLEAWTDHQEAMAQAWGPTLKKDLADAIAEIYRARENAVHTAAVYDDVLRSAISGEPVDFTTIRQDIKTR